MVFEPDMSDRVQVRLPRIISADRPTRPGCASGARGCAGAVLGPFCRVLARFGRFFRIFGEKPKTPSPGN